MTRARLMGRVRVRVRVGVGVGVMVTGMGKVESLCHCPRVLFPLK